MTTARPLRTIGAGRIATALLAAVAVGLSLGACGTSEESPANAPQPAGSQAPSGPWEFTDDRGTKISLPERPKRIVAQVHAAASLWDFGIKPVGVFGPQTKPDGSPDAQAGNVDLKTTTSVGSAFGEFNLERYTRLDPDLVVTIMYGPVLWYVPQEAQPKIEQRAPIVGIRLDGKSAAEAIARFGELARSLGADVDGDSVQQARAGFEKASQDLKAAAAAKPGLTVQMAIGQQEGYWVVDPKWHGDAKLFKDLGVDVVAPADPNPAFGFEQLSWEQATKYPADLILEDARTVGMNSDELAAKFPTWKELPAVKAGQVAPWRAETPSSYQLYTAVLTELTKTIANARTDVVA
nr:iron compound ABC transporter, periplasmic [uncultured bacterium]